MSDTEFPFLRLRGSHYAMGLQLGRLSRMGIRAFLEDRLARINAVIATPMTMESMTPVLRRYQASIAQHLPGIHEELLGLAEGAGISPLQAVLLQTRRELTRFSPYPPGGDCTTFAIGEGSTACLAQTIDLNGGLCSELNVVHISHEYGGNVRKSLMVSFTGLLGYLGMNDRGLAIGLNLVLSGSWGPGIPGYMAIRHLLDTADSVEHALEILKELPLASSRSLTLVDGKRKVLVEYVRDEMQMVEAKCLVHANHFLLDAFQARDELNPLAAIFSRQRQEACEQNLIKFGSAPSALECMQILSEAPIYVASSENLKREQTVASVVMEPSAGKMWVRQAGSDEMRCFSLDAESCRPDVASEAFIDADADASVSS